MAVRHGKERGDYSFSLKRWLFDIQIKKPAFLVALRLRSWMYFNWKTDESLCAGNIHLVHIIFRYAVSMQQMLKIAFFFQACFRFL